jgi:hypothetical protein
MEIPRLMRISRTRYMAEENQSSGQKATPVPLSNRNAIEANPGWLQLSPTAVCDSCMLGCHTIQQRSVPMFQGDVLPPSSG